MSIGTLEYTSYKFNKQKTKNNTNVYKIQTSKETN